MHLKHHLLLLLTLFLSLPPPSISSHFVSSDEPTDISQWCDTTPHPGPCRYYLAHTRRSNPLKNRKDFYKLVVRLSLDLTLRAQSHLKRIVHQCRSEPQKTAWIDCWRLYATSVAQLNRTLGDCSPLDAQTWLSASLTNLDTCHRGFTAIGEPPSMVQPVTHYNVSDLISNCLAINNVTNMTTSSSADQWMSVGGRRLLQLSVKADFVVAKDGSGGFGNIKGALDAASQRRKSGGGGGRIVIYVKAGVYSEIVNIVSSLDNITMVGDGIGKTIITGSRSMANGFTTFSSPTFSVFGDRFIASGITIRNTFGPGSQAVALLSASDQSVFYRCSFEGYQDTLCVFSQRQFYRECDIYGTIDFIFGNAAVVLQGCNIFARRPRPGESNVITAQGRTDPNQNTGIVIHSSNIKPTPELLASPRTVKSYLGRPWQRYSRTLYLRSFLSGIIDPAGWVPFNGNFALDTLYYAEYGNNGSGSRRSGRVTWPGYHLVVRTSEVQQFSVGRFIAGRQWLPSTTVPFNALI